MMFKKGSGSRESKRYVVGIQDTPNKLGNSSKKPRLIPLNELRLGESLHFDKKQMLESDVQRAKNCARTANAMYCLQGEDMFKILEKPSELEIVRIR